MDNKTNNNFGKNFRNENTAATVVAVVEPAKKGFWGSVKSFTKTTTGKVTIATALAVVIGAGCTMAYRRWKKTDDQPAPEENEGDNE